MTQLYNDPLVNKYASKEIVQIFSDNNRYKTWRKLWLQLAKHQKDLGINITSEQIDSLESNIDNFDFDRIQEIESSLQHDVMAHIHYLAEIAPKAKPIIHLGATSEYIKDNTDLILIKQALEHTQSKLKKLIDSLCTFSEKNADIPTLGFTHLQVAQPTTVGKRSSLWLYSFFNDYKDIDNFLSNLEFRGVKGTTGTLASFKELFNGSYEKTNLLNEKITKSFGFNKSFSVSGQTYDRKLDFKLLNLFASLGISAHKATNDIRILQSRYEIAESFAKSQIGSSAMPYKKNPIKCERVSSLSKLLLSLPSSASLVASTQWLERTLDDSANRRVTIPTAFFTVDSVISIMQNIIDNLTVNKKVIENNLNKEIPFLATENLLMKVVKQGGDRQETHEVIRKLSIEVRQKVIEENTENNLIKLILEQIPHINITESEIQDMLQPKEFTGFAKEQTYGLIEEIKNYLR